MEGVCSYPSHSPSTYRPGFMSVSIIIMSTCALVCTVHVCVVYVVQVCMSLHMSVCNINFV